jgi:RHS repeat-associated protein
VELNNVTYQVRTDHLGTPLELVNAANNVVWRAHYESFGNAVIEDDVDGDGNHIEFNVRLPGQYYDAESGLSYNLHRYYDPTTGRYVTSDPIGLRGGINTYAYVRNNPLRYTDPKGLNPMAAGRMGWAVGSGINYAFQAAMGASIGAFIYDAMHNDSEDDAENDRDKNDKKRKACQALKDSILNTCASLCGRQKFDCFAAAQESFNQCMDE